VQPNQLIQLGLYLDERAWWTHPLGWTSSAPPFREEFLGVASGEFSCFEKALAEVIGSGDRYRS
jgi:hypothetical protein